MMEDLIQRPHVGFYVHYHGIGHKQRTAVIIEYLHSKVSVVASRMEEMKWNGSASTDFLKLACDNVHFAPLWSDNISDRVARYTDWLNRTKPDVMVVDVSVSAGDGRRDDTELGAREDNLRRLISQS